MKKLIVLFSGMIIAAGAAAQADRTTASATQPQVQTQAQTQKQDSTDRRTPVTTGRERENRWQESIESANSVDPDFQGSSKQQATASGMGQPTTATEGRTAPAKPKTDAQDVEDKTRK